MTEISSAGMVTYYNHITMYRQQQQQAGMHQQHLTSQQQQQAAATAAAVVAGAAAAAAAEGSQQYWYSYPHGHPSSGSSHQSSPGSQHQYLDHLSSASGDVLSCSWPPHAHPYSHHIPYQQQLYHHQNQQSPMTSTSTPTDWSMSKNHNNNNSNNNNNNNISNNNNSGLTHGEPSPPITISGSEISSPGTPASPNISNLNATNNTNTSSSASTPVKSVPVRSPFEWMKKSSYIHNQNPGKTRTKDKYRVVYTDHQRLELEKEFHFSRYITIRRKAELATHLALSERQVKIWFQNRRAKERKQVKKREELEQKEIKPNIIHQEGLQTPGGMVALSALSGMTGMLSGLMHNGNSPPLNLGPQAHSLGLNHPNSSIHSHAHQHVHPHSVLGL